ncbi:branched-chain amino acid ABC transporter permease [Dactylosporangium sp. CA-139114]|uniref:branched-chain amino acid ABC transporter permease n=1 Tax=Dactylosporangium sp. CA-139114 TaxID=3239931 RepID=UPI003D96267C
MTVAQAGARISTTTSVAARRAALPLIVGGAVAAPWLLDAYTISLGSYALVLGLLATSTHLLTTVAGLPSLGQGAYLIIGGYTAATASRTLTTNGPAQILVAVAVAAAAAALVGVFATRTRGTTFLITTVAVGVLTQTLASRAAPITGGDAGRIVGPVTLWPGTEPITRNGYLYLYALTCTIAVTAALALLLRTRFGLALRGAAEHEPRTRAAGHPTGGHLMLAYVIAAAIAGAAGALLVATRHTIAPSDGGFVVSALALLAALLTTRTQTGALLGAVVIVATRDLLAPSVLAGHAATLLGCLFLAAAAGRAAIRRRRPAEPDARTPAGRWQ